MAEPQHFLFVFVGEFTQLAFANAIEPLRIANRMSGETLYTWSFMSEDGGAVTASNGVRMLMDHSFNDCVTFDQLFIITGNDVQEHISKRLLALVRRTRYQGIPVAAFCSGAFVLAEAGLLDGRSVALHWEFHAAFSETYPDIDLSPGVYVKDSAIMTAAGGQAAADMVLDLIAARHGEGLAVTVSDQMVYNSVRTASATQRVSFQARFGIRCDVLSKAMQVMERDLDAITTMTEVAAHTGVSIRQLERLFKKHLNTTPKKHLQTLRLARGRQLLQQTEMSVTEVTLACGFENPSHFSRVYRQAYGVGPRQQRAI